MFAPIRPNPIIPSCMVASLSRGFDAPRGSRAAVTRSMGLHAAIALDQRIGGAVVRELARNGSVELRQDALSKDLAELDTPLIERVDLPDHALGEDAVLVESDEL